jgi:serine/threonine protein phosphatase PrpC
MSRSWKSWGCTLTGSEHVRLAMPNQDAWKVRHYWWGDTVALSDGIGSRRKAHIGSAAACDAVIEAAKFCQRHDPVDLEDRLKLIQTFWRMMVYPLPAQDCSATCLFVVRHNGGAALLGLLGDGLIAACRRNGSVDVLVNEKMDSFSNVTNGLGYESGRFEWRFLKLPENEYCAFILCSDGISDDLLPESVSSFVWEILNRQLNMCTMLRRQSWGV